MILISSRKYYNQFINGINLDQNLTDFTHYLLGFVGQKMKRITEIDISWLSFSATNSDAFNVTTIDKNIIKRTIGSWQDDGFAVGDDIFFNDFDSVDKRNNIITNLTDLEMTCQDDFDTTDGDGNPGFTLPAFSGNAVVYGKTKLLGMNYFSNFVENNDPVGYISKVDGISTKKWAVEFTESEYDASTEKTATASGTNESWKVISDEVKIKNIQIPDAGNSYHQKFQITEIFTITPFFDTIDNLEAGIKPDYLIDAFSLRHIARFESTRTLLNPIIKHILDDSEVPDTFGNVGYYDEQYNGFTPVEFTKDSIAYSNPSNEDKIVVDETTAIMIKIDSLNDLFLQSNTEFQLNIIFLNENIDNSENIDTNYAFDTLFAVADNGSNSGVNGILSNVVGNIVSNQLVITADIDYTITQQSLIDNGKYIISVATNDHTLSIDQSKLVNVLLDINSYIKNNDIPDLIGIDSNLFYEHPFDKGTQGKTDFKGWVEDGILVSSDFWLDLSLSAVINTLNLKLVAYNSGTGNFFELTDIPFDFTTTIISNGIQEIDVDSIRGFKLVADSQFNFIKIKKMAKVGDKQHYDLDVGIKLQWMDWINLLDADTIFYDNNKLQNGLNRLISNYSAQNGYEIVIFVDAEVSDGTVNTNYRFISPAIRVYEYDTDDTGDPSTRWSGQVDTFDQSSNNLQGNIILSENTDIKITFTALVGILSEVVLYAIVRLEEYQQGGLLNIWELSSFRDSAVNNPLIPLTGQNKTIYTTFLDYVEVECSIDFNKLNPGSQYKISGRLGTACNESTGCAWEPKIVSVFGPPFANTLLGIDFLDINNGFACGGSGSIIKTTDAGETWVVIPSGTTNLLRDILFFDSNILYTCGNNGTLLKSINGGDTWVSKAPITGKGLFNLAFASATIGWVCGTTGVIFKTTNGGTGWSAQTSGTSNKLNSIFFIDSSNGWAVGISGTIINTTDGGTNWNPQTSPFTGVLEEIQFIDSNIGWIAGHGGTVLLTIDGGNNWILITISGNPTLRSISFIDADNGIVCGDGGEIYRTIDGGNNWTQESSGTLKQLLDVKILTLTDGYIVGNTGTILKYVCTTDCGILDNPKLKEDGTQKFLESGDLKIKE